MTPVAIEINGFSHSFHSSTEAILKRTIFVAKWDKRFEKREAGLRLSQSRTFISAA
jgi:ribosomal protein L31